MPVGRFRDFLPSGATRCTDEGKIWRAEVDRWLATPNFTHIGARAGIRDPKTVNLANLGILTSHSSGFVGNSMIDGFTIFCLINFALGVQKL